MLDRVVFLVRQSPDWEALAADHRRGVPIAPGRYRPREPIPTFPANIADLIERWNRICPIGYFDCRVALKRMTTDLLHSVRNAVVLNEADIPTLAQRFAGTDYLLFCLDDDDWFSPDTFQLVASLDFGEADIAVFPLVRFGRPTFTFVRSPETTRIAVGAMGPFSSRFQTNNYGLRPSVCVPHHLRRLKDHLDGSKYADAVGLTDRYYDLPISATNKTPCSASILPSILEYRRDFFRYIASYVEHLRAAVLPSELRWAEPPLRRTRELFEAMLPDRARSVHWLSRQR